MKKKISRVIFSLFLIMVFIMGTYTILSVKSYAIKVSVPDPNPGAKWRESCCGPCCAYDYCAGVGQWNCCLK